MNWLTEFVRPKIRALVGANDVPDNLWHSCPSCEQMLFHRELTDNLHVCHGCGHHLRLSAKDELGKAFWDELIDVRDAVNKCLEAMRADGALRGSLDAEVTLYCGDELRGQLESLGEELRFVLITSDARVLPLEEAGDTAVGTARDDLRIAAEVSANEKCERCWHRRADVGVNPEHPTLCGRCVTNVVGAGEVRYFA